MTITSLFGAKGGVGTTTIACALAIHRAGEGPTLLVQTGERPDAQRILGTMVEPDKQHVAVKVGKLDLYSGARWEPEMFEAYEHVVIDWGTKLPTVGKYVLVTDNSYASLAAALDASGKLTYNTVALVSEYGRPLGKVECKDILGNRRTIEVMRNPAIGRTCDAGMLSSRELPKALATFVAQI
jgi:hypothetical protein